MPESPDDNIDWELTTFEGNRRRQHLEFLALPFREKVRRLEDFAKIEALFAKRRNDAREERLESRGNA